VHQRRRDARGRGRGRGRLRGVRARGSIMDGVLGVAPAARYLRPRGGVRGRPLDAGRHQGAAAGISGLGDRAGEGGRRVPLPRPLRERRRDGRRRGRLSNGKQRRGLRAGRPQGDAPGLTGAQRGPPLRRHRGLPSGRHYVGRKVGR
jgi:hypothetical protein